MIKTLKFLGSWSAHILAIAGSVMAVISLAAGASLNRWEQFTWVIAVGVWAILHGFMKRLLDLERSIGDTWKRLYENAIQRERSMWS